MKKWITFLCTLICILGLTACGGSGEQLSQADQAALTDAESYAKALTLNFLSSFMEDDVYNVYSPYSKEELEYIMENTSQGAGILIDGYGFLSAMESFHMSGATTGKILDITGTEAKIDGSQIIVSLDAHCEKRDANVEIILSNDIFFRLESASLNPSYKKSELMEKAALNTVLGMGTVFSVLILISLIIACFGLIPKIQASFTRKEKVDTTGIDNAVAQIGQQEEILEEEDDTELVAVIAAAVSAYEGSSNTDGFVVRSIRRR